MNRTPLPTKLKEDKSPSQNAALFNQRYPNEQAIAEYRPSSEVVFTSQQRRVASPREAVPHKNMTTADLTNYVNSVINSSIQQRSPAVVQQSSPRVISRASPVISRQGTPVAKRTMSPAVIQRTPSIQRKPILPSVSRVPHVQSIETDSDDRAIRRPGPVIVTMDTQLKGLSDKIPPSAMTMSKEPRSDNMIIKTPYGEFVIPNYDLMTKRECDRARESYKMQFAQINLDWKHTGDVFEGPRPDEDIINLAVRYRETEKYLLSKTGTDFWFIICCAFWAFIEYQACKFKLPATGYVEIQIGQYKMYQSQLTRMGASTATSIGEDWPPYVQMAVTSGFSLAVLVLMAKCGVGNKSGAVMKQISSMISGNKNVDVSAAGTPKPAEGGMIEMMTGMASGGGMGAAMSMFTGFMGLGGSKKKKKKKSKKTKAKDLKEAEEAADIDI